MLTPAMQLRPGKNNFLYCAHIIIAAPTAPPTTRTISFLHPLVNGASPVCKLGLPVVVAVEATPADPVGVSLAALAPATTVIAVTTDLLPSAKVLVCTTVLVEDGALWVFVEVVALDVGEMVLAPPPTVETMVRPTPLVVVIT